MDDEKRKANRKALQARMAAAGPAELEALAFDIMQMTWRAWLAGKRTRPLQELLADSQRLLSPTRFGELCAWLQTQLPGAAGPGLDADVWGAFLATLPD